MGSIKHFLDTSVMRFVLLGTQKYKDYFKTEFNNHRCYISNFIQMEFRRSYIYNIIKFYTLLNFPDISNINDAIQFWSNHFQKSKLKAILQFLSDHNIDFCQSPDKQKAKYSICRYIKRINIKLKHKFKNIGKDSCKCVRGKIPISISLKNMDNDINDFILAFDKKEYSSKCHIDNFIFNRYKVQIGKFIKKAEGLKKKDDTIGFINLVKNLNDVTKKETSYLSCKICERIGDVVIALETPREMILEHTDYSFNLLCPIIDQPHKQHISEMKYIKK